MDDAPLGYRLAEQNARLAGLGIWGSEFDMPWDWRETHHGAESGGPTADCLIKGHEDATGRYYLGPLDEAYEDTNPGAGETPYFCSDEEAREAGWVRPGQH